MQSLRINEPTATTSFIKRKSLKGTSIDLEDIPQNDDEAERKQRKRDSGVFANLASKRVSLGGITDLTTTELVAQYANCMRLSAENKINHKNAFNLPLIDCMKVLLKNKDEQMDNFQVVGCTLDASAKIYASRVDRVHMDGISFAKGLGSRSKDLPASQMECSDSELNEENRMTEKKKKRGKKPPKLSREVSKINLPSKVVVQDPTFVVLSKQFSNCQPSFISFFPKLKLVGDNCKVLMDMKAPFLADTIEHSYGEERVPFECNIDGNPEIVTLPFKNILSRDLDDSEYNSLLTSAVLEDSFDERDDVENNYDDMPDDPINDETVGNGMLEAYSDAKNSSTWKGGCEMELEAARAGCAARNFPREKVVDVQEAILKHVKEGSNLDYLYTNLDRILWAGPTHWHSLPCSKVRDKNSAITNLKRKGKKVTKMDFSSTDPVKLVALRTVVLTTQYIDNKWSADQVTNPPDLHVDIKILTRYFLRSKCGFTYSSVETSAPPEDDDVHDYDYDNLNDSQHFCPAASPGPISEGDNSANKDLPGLEGECEPAPDVHSFETASGDAWCMVDPPTKVARIQVPYAQHAKKIDMKVLKSAIWTVLCEDSSSDSIGDAELTPRKKMKNEKVNSKVDSASMTREIKFSALERKVLKIVPPEMAQELSMPLVFTALLHLANERVLSLRGLEDHSDIFISQDRGADSFVKRLQERQFV